MLPISLESALCNHVNGSGSVGGGGGGVSGSTFVGGGAGGVSVFLA